MSTTLDQSRHAVISAKKTYWKNDASNSPPPIVPKDQGLKDDCNNSLLKFLTTVFPVAFPLAFGPTHLRMISEIQRCIDEGGLKAIAAPRGSGKTTIILRAALWALLSRRRRYVAIVASDESTAVSNLATLKVEVNHNPVLKELYGYETWALRQLDNEPRRAATQHWNGTPTGVHYGQNLLNFGTIPDCPTNGSVISTAGITGKIRGQQALTPEGEIIRPDFVLVDDPQTKLSAASPSQVQKRHETMQGDILGLAGPGVKVSGFCTCTVIYQDDLADRLLNRRLSPDWNGDKVEMIQEWPKWMEGWDEYNSIRVEELATEQPPTKSREFVAKNFDRLHAGAKVYWEDRKSKQDASALHHAMDLYFRDPGVFACEFQNSPLDALQASPYKLDAHTLSKRITGLPKGIIAEEVDKVTAFIDTQRELLYYMVCAWTGTGRCFIVDYGSAPNQQRHYWTKTTVKYSLQDIYGDDFETYLRGGLDWLLEALLENEYTTERGAKIMIDRVAIDARWGESTHIIRRLARESKHRSRLHPSMGMYVGANSAEWQQMKNKTEKRRDTRGVHARLVTPKMGGRRELMYDTNYWKSFAADRLMCAESSPKAITLFNAKPHQHQMVSEHFANEESLRIVGKRGNEVIEWKQKESGTPENDYWDCLVGNCALASTIGVETHHNNRRNTFAMNQALQRAQKNKDKFFRSR